MTWEISRAAAFTAYLLFFVTIILGIVKSYGRLKKERLVFANLLHNYAGVGGIILLLVHMAALLFDKYIAFTFRDLLLPFASSFKPLGIALGVFGFYGFAVIIMTSTKPLIRLRAKQKKLWKAIHMSSYLAFVAALFHGLMSGTDSAYSIVQAMYYVTGITPILLLSLRPFILKKKGEENYVAAAGRG